MAERVPADCGIARVDTLDGLIEGFPLLRARAGRAARRAPRSAWSPPRRAAPTMVVDPLARAALPSSRRAPRRWRASRPRGSTSTPARIVDLTLAGTRYDVMKGALDILTTAPDSISSWR